jgi:16S rRNA (uracil1498-N3)-methyltransferase
MRNTRIYTPQPLFSGGQIDLEGPASQHLTQVLRLRVGGGITLFNGDGTEYQAEIIQIGRSCCRLNVTQGEILEMASPLDIHLALGISKGERMEIAIQKAVELGVMEIVPIISERTNLRMDNQRLEKKHFYWNNIVISACEQSHRNRLPILGRPQRLVDWVHRELPDTAMRLVLDPTSEQPLATLAPPELGQSVWLLIGPEGGITPQELQLAAKHGFTGVRLGPRVLRTETAPLAAISAMQALWGDFR